MDVVAEGGASLKRQRGGQHFEDGVHGAAFPQSLVQRLDVDAAGDEVGHQQEEVESLETWEWESDAELHLLRLTTENKRGFWENNKNFFKNGALSGLTDLPPRR